MLLVACKILSRIENSTKKERSLRSGSYRIGAIEVASTASFSRVARCNGKWFNSGSSKDAEAKKLIGNEEIQIQGEN
jgi:hypothetical protein